MCFTMPLLTRALAPLFWITYSVPAGRQDSLTVPTVESASITVPTTEMPVSDVNVGFIMYRMARNFRGTKFSRIGRWQRFCENIFVVRPMVRRSQSTKHDDHKISQLKFSLSEANPRKPRKFCPAKISRHTVYW